MTPERNRIELPLHDAPPECWANVVNLLEQEEILETKLLTLPSHEAPDRWNAIVADISVHASRHLYAWTLSAAAILIIGLVVGIIEWRYREGGIITVSTEMAATEVGFDQSDVSIDAIELIRNASDQTEGVAANTAFHEMVDDLKRLETEQSDLEREIEKNGAIPELIKARIEVENRRAQTTKNLVRIIML